ncbi:CASP-like protein 1F1 [Linum perenne]
MSSFLPLDFPSVTTPCQLFSFPSSMASKYLQQQEQQQQPSNNNSPAVTKNKQLGVHVLLRALSFAFALSAAITTLTNQQTTEVLPGFVFVARYYYSSALRFFAVANLVASAFSLGSLLYLLKERTQSGGFYVVAPRDHCFVLFLHDLVTMVLVLAACSAATAIGIVAMFGEDHSGWMPICGHFHRFCSKATISVALSYMSFASLFVLTILSANYNTN